MKEMVGPYRVVEELGRGGMGIVFRGVHDRLQREVAIKQLSPALTANPQFKERFFSEARTQAQLQHPNIVTIYDLIEEDGEFFIVMQYFEGRGLDEVIDESSGQGMAPAKALEIFCQVLEALDCAHSLGVIHRDVKPSNVLIDERGRVQLMDFGIALLVGDKRLTQSSQTIGTPIYMSPEQILRPRELDHRTDIYSAAVMFFEMLSGRPPFDAETEYEIKKFHLERPPAEAVAALGGIDPAVRQAIEHALAKDPADRFSSAREFHRAITGGSAPSIQPPTAAMESPVGTRLEENGASGTTAAAGPSRPSPSAPGALEIWRRPAVMAVAALLMVLLGVALLFAYVGGGPEETPVAVENIAADAAEPTPRAVGTAGGGGSEVRTSTASPAGEEPPGGKGGAGTSPDPGTSTAAASPPPTAVDPRKEARRRAAQEEEIQRRLVGETRRQVADAIATARRLVSEGDFEEARSTVQRGLSRSAPYRSDLVDEVVTLQLLEQEITDRVVARKSEKEKRRLAREAWDLRIGEVEELIDEGKYPEARQLAERLLEDGALPADLASRVRELEERAQEELKNVWSKTEVEESTTVVNPRRKKKRGGGNAP